MLPALRHLQTLEGSVKSSDADTSRGRRTDVSMESMPPPKRTGTEKRTETGVETEGVKEVLNCVFPF